MTPIDAERCLTARDLTEPRLAPDGGRIGFAVSADGAACIEWHDLDDRGRAPTDRAVRTLATMPSLRPARGLGGGAWCFTADGAAVVYAAVDGNLWLQNVEHGPALCLTTHGPERSASGPCAAPDGRSVVYAIEQSEVWCCALDGSSTRRVDRGDADFCLDPYVAPDGSVLWLAWDVPDMPWDHSRIERAGADGSALPVWEGRVAVQQPRTLPDGRPLTVRDDGGWLNLWLDGQPLVAEPYEHGGPTWGPGQRSFAVDPSGRRVAFTRNEAGFGRLCVVDVANGRVDEVARGVHGQLTWEAERLTALRTGARTPTQVVIYDTRSWQRTVVATGPSTDWTDDELVEPDAVVVPAGDEVIHARLYRSALSDGRLIIWLHGGPTDQWQVTFMARIAYYRSRGWNVLVPDHRGSTGHGRAYQQALRGRWGELDVADTIAAAQHAHAQGWGRPNGTVLMGSSAGGFTALGALGAAPEHFAAAAVLFPVTDLLDFGDRSHRFERHYNDTLVGPLPALHDVYRRRSPVWHAHDYTSRPILVLHGELDPVVPVAQSRVFVERVRAAGGTIELHVYPGEGHGFRAREHQLDELRRVEAFIDSHCR